MTEHLRKDRAAAGRIGGLTRASREIDPKAAAQRGQRGLIARFEKQVPAEVTDPAQRTRMAELALRAHMSRLAVASAKKRRARSAA
ncbi:hypothetical protein MED01_004231 [Micromonospora sp. MED01]|uniref:hypothetical protein n=1 Tax=Micromonospora alfalfae TaxID=2911212 RepID=UPI001EE8A50C|nr:hypothetical protein [Micromonospora alfalfae]MCG5460805.1 hypothetical protein [Micromonospora alfalfae]